MTPKTTVWRRLVVAGLIATFVSPIVRAKILDDFNDNTKTSWTDFSFQPPLGFPTERNGQFVFTMPPAGQALFSASTKMSETFTLKEGRTIEFRVDLVSGNGKDAFAVLAFIPTSSSASSLAGYGFAKSTTDILVTKGIGRYFYNVNPTPALKNENVTMVLSMTGSGGNVVVNAKVLDKDAGNAVIFDRTVIDTPAADVLANGSDSPSAPYLSEGRFVLYLYEDFDARAPQDSYEVVYDNAETFVMDRVLVDDFNDNTKTSWTDFSFAPPLGFPTEKVGQFVFTMPPAGQAIFSASTKTSPLFDLVDGQRLEFQVDLVSGNGKDAFAILSWAPRGISPSSLSGYSIAKSTTDILITKGIGKYFYNADPTPALKNENVTLSLSLTGVGQSVMITGKVLDRDANNAVIFEKTFVDTTGADVLANGTDSPATPYVGSGNLVLFLYQDFDTRAPQDSYEVIFDNLVALAPPAANNVAPLISDTTPVSFGNFLAISNVVSFRATDDKALGADKLSIDLNGTVYKQGSGLTVTGTGTNLVASVGGLKANQNYAATVKAEDSEGLATTAVIYFDTFDPASHVIEVEDYNFGGGQFIDNPVPAPQTSGLAGSYSEAVGVQNVDFSDTRTSPRTSPYRSSDSVAQAKSLDIVRSKFTAAGGADATVFDYDITEVSANEFLNFTRTFAPGTYEVYLREALVNTAQAEVVLERVTGDRTQENQSTVVLGSFLSKLTGFVYRNFPLTDALGREKVLLNLSGVTTLRLRQVTTAPGDGIISQNYLVFIPATGSGVQRATVSGIVPASGSVTETTEPEVKVTLLNRDTKVNNSSIVLTLNGSTVTPRLQTLTNGAVVSYSFPTLPKSGDTNTARIVFADDAGVSQTNDWSFVITYRGLDAANSRSGPGKTPGFKVRMVQAPAGSQLENRLDRAELQLAPNSTIPVALSNSVISQVINFTQNELPSNDGYFPDAETIPGLSPTDNGTDDIALEIQAWLQLSAGIYRFGVRCDDGYKITAGTSLTDTTSPALAFHNGGPADETFDVIVPQAGLYPIRMIWYERGGSAFVELFTVDRTTNEKILVNDSSNPKSVKAFTEIEAPTTRVLSAATVKGPYSLEAGATLDLTAKTATITPQGSARFYIIEGQSRISQIRLSGGKVILSFP